MVLSSDTMPAPWNIGPYSYFCGSHHYRRNRSGSFIHNVWVSSMWVTTLQTFVLVLKGLRDTHKIELFSLQLRLSKTKYTSWNLVAWICCYSFVIFQLCDGSLQNILCTIDQSYEVRKLSLPAIILVTTFVEFGTSPSRAEMIIKLLS